MSECTKCGRYTENAAIGGMSMRGRDPLEEFNGIVWLCDEHRDGFIDWLDNE